MKDSGSSNPGQEESLLQKMSELEQRIASLEQRMDSYSPAKSFGPGRIREQDDVQAVQDPVLQDEAIESRIGEYGMAWMGNIVLLVGILFLTQFLKNNDQMLLSLVFGFSSIILVYLLGYLTRNSLPYMSRLFGYNAHLLLFIQVLRITLLEGARVIQNPILGHAMIVVVLLVLYLLAYRKNLQALLVLTWIMTVISAVASGYTHFMLPLAVGICATAILFVIKKAWWTSLIVSIFLVYFIFLIWLIGNPILNGAFEVRSTHEMGYIYLYTVALAYSFLALLRPSEQHKQKQLQPAIILNGLGFSLLIALMVPAFFSENYYIYFSLIAGFCLGYSIFLKVRGDWKTIAAMYALYSFVSISITIAGIFHFPLAFLLLSIQSLLVVSMALWFRSRFMVIMNTILFTSLLIAYLVTAEPQNSINFSFALVALVTARILNWKKERLEIRTELIRNIFLFTGAGMVLFSLNKAVPDNFVSLSWTMAAMLFFVLSVLIKNKKYRWLGIITLVITVFYFFIVDLSNISLGYRVIALMFIAAISLGISIFYSRRLKSSKKESD